MRYFLDLAYDGSAFHGWQRQPNAVSVQESIEQSLATIFQKEISIVGAGRTDTGVHAKQLFAHLDFEDIQDTEQLQFKLNGLLPKQIAVNSIIAVQDDAHARFDATSREYKYYITTKKDPFLSDYSLYIKRELNVEKMNKAAALLKNYIDFKCFSKSKTDVHTYNCKIEYARWEIENETLVFTIRADRFLRNMVRAIVGTLVEIGLDKWEINRMHQIIESRDRGKAGTSVEAKGLFLTKIEYPNTILKTNYGQ